MQTVKEVLTRREAAAFLNISLRKLDQLIGRRHVPVVRIDRKVLLRREALLAFLKSRETPDRKHDVFSASGVPN